MHKCVRFDLVLLNSLEVERESLRLHDLFLTKIFLFREHITIHQNLEKYKNKEYT